MGTHPLILVVDDDRDIRQSLRIMLENNGYEISTAADSLQAMATLKTITPDLIILDVMMTTDTEGFDLAHDLRAKPEYKEIPIIMLTSFLDKVREEGPDQYQHIMGQQWPAKWIFEKPINQEKLLAKLKAILNPISSG